MLLAVPDLLAVEGASVTQRIAEHLGQEIALHLRFIERREAARTLQIGPFHQYVVGGVQFFRIESFVFSRVLQKSRQD